MQKILESKGLLYKDNYEGWYSVADECYYTPAQIAPGPEPNSEAFVSKETGSSVVWTREENYKFRLSKFQPYLLEHFSQSNSTTIDSTGLSGSNTVSGDEGSSDLTQVFPQQHHDWVLHTLRNHQLEDLSVSRPISRLEWGIRVPGDPGHTIYVWFDALMSYLSGIGYPWGPSSSAEGAVSGNTMAEFGRPQGWPVNLQIIGKDIVRCVSSRLIHPYIF
jgi:methionyl-tRNA synthetase